MERITAFITSILPLVESKAFSLLLALGFAAFIAYAAHSHITQQRDMILLLHGKLLERYEKELTLVQQCKD